MDITSLITNKDLENEGVWIDGPEDSKFKIRSADSKPYKARLAALSRRENPAKLRKDVQLQTRLTIEAMASDLLLDWQGIKENGTDLAPTEANKIKLLNIPQIRDLIATEAQDVANFQAEGLAADAADIKSGD